MLNNVSNFFISVEGASSFLSNGQSTNKVYIEPIQVRSSSTQAIVPTNLIFSSLYKNILIDTLTVPLLGDNNSPIDMTGGWRSNPELFSVTLILQDIKD